MKLIKRLICLFKGHLYHPQFRYDRDNKLYVELWCERCEKIKNIDTNGKKINLPD